MEKKKRNRSVMKKYKNIKDFPVTIPEKMKALVLSGKGFSNLELKEISVPSPGKNQFLARVDAVFGCRSDCKLIENGKNHPLLYGWDLERWPISIGHEGCITAVQVGENLASQISVGDTFAVQPAINIGPINYRERYTNPDALEKTAIGYSLGGMFAEYILITEEVIQTKSLIPYDTEKVPYFSAAFSEPLSCVYSAQNQVPHIYIKDPLSKRDVELGLKKGGVTLILGAGPMGILNADLAMIYKPKTIIISEPIEERREYAKQILFKKSQQRGVELIITSPQNLSEIIENVTEARGVDDCIAALGVAKVQEQALDYLAKGGVANLFGGTKPKESLIYVDVRRVHYDSISLVGSSGGYPSDVKAVMSLMAEKEISPNLYVKRVGGLDSAFELMESLQSQKFFGKGLIYPHIRHPLKVVDSWSFKKENEFLEKNLSLRF